jgi:hypothetical protein
MAQLKVNVITNRSDNGSPVLTQGATIPSGKTISGSGDMNVVGIVSATSFVGDGSALGQFASASKAYAIKLILDPIPFRS